MRGLQVDLVRWLSFLSSCGSYSPNVAVDILRTWQLISWPSVLLHVTMLDVTFATMTTWPIWGCPYRLLWYNMLSAIVDGDNFLALPILPTIIESADGSHDEC